MSTPQIAMELYHAARDAILLYRSIVPVMVGYISEGHLLVSCIITSKFGNQNAIVLS
jgi:hypothetical protein